MFRALFDKNAHDKNVAWLQNFEFFATRAYCSTIIFMWHLSLENYACCLKKLSFLWCRTISVAKCPYLPVPVIRSTEMQWSIPQIWKIKTNFEKFQSQTSFSFWLLTMPGDRSVNQLAADQQLASRYYLNFDTTLVAWHALSVVRVQFGGLCLVFNDHVWATKFPTAQEEEGEKSWSFLVVAFTAGNFVFKKKGPHFAFCSRCSVDFTIDHGCFNDITRHVKCISESLSYSSYASLS